MELSLELSKWIGTSSPNRVPVVHTATTSSSSTSASSSSSAPPPPAVVVTVWTAPALHAARSQPGIASLYAAIDQLGALSKQSQGLNTVLTSCERLKTNPAHRLYLLTCGRQVIGLIKMGEKKLFVRPPHNPAALQELEPLCCLDFYVLESEQRNGWGLRLFQTMLQAESVEPRHVAIDRPSPKFLSFLRKYFSLSEYTPQTNHFVVFHQFWATTVAAGSSKQASALLQSSQMQRGGGGGSGGLCVCTDPNSRGGTTSSTTASSAVLHNAATTGLAGGSVKVNPQHTTATSADIMRMMRTSSLGGGSTANRRGSPVRGSAVDYNIITGAYH